MKIIALVIIIGSCSPFIYNIASRHRNSKEAKILWNSGNGQKAWLAGLLLLRILIGVGVVSYAIVRIFTLTSGMLIGISLLLIVIIMMSRSVKRRSRGLEEQFNKNLTAREVSADKRRPFTKAFESSLLPYDIHISTFTLPADSSFSGKTLSQLNVRKHSGVSIVRIIRAGVFTNIPGGSKHVYPGDQIVVAGSDEQIDKFKQMIDGSIMKEKPETREHVTLENFTLEEGNPLIGRSIIESNIRNEAHCIVMGIKRGNDYLMNPEPQEVFEPDDIVIVAGETELLKQFINSFNP
jgi:CPA2 family monovalent cation:H+ antiporter-2